MSAQRYSQHTDTTTPALGSEAKCRTCQRRIVYEVVETPGYQPRTGWSDQFPRDALVCFKANDYAHRPEPRRLTNAEYEAWQGLP